jgi:hypothetical protein
MKLNLELLQQIIKEELGKVRTNQPFKSASDREQYLRNQQKRYSKERQARDDLYPESLRSLSRGVLAEGELLTDEDEEGFVKIKKSALERLLVENKLTPDQVKSYCNKRNYLSLDQYLRIQDAFSDAKSGKYGDPKKPK